MLFVIGYYNINLRQAEYITKPGPFDPERIPPEIKRDLWGTIPRDLWLFLEQHAILHERADGIAHWGQHVRVYAEIPSHKHAILLQIQFPQVRVIDFIPD